MKRYFEFAVLTFALWSSTPQTQGETLREAWIEAATANPELSAARLEADAARFDLEAARSERLPSAWMRSAYSVRSDQRNFRIDNPLSPGQTFVTPYQQREAASASSGVGVPLYAGGRISSSIQGAEARMAAAGYEASASKLALTLAVSEAYLEVLRAQRELAVAEESVVSLSAHRANVERQFAAEQASRNDLLAAQVAASRAEQSRLQRRRHLETVRGGYNRLLARPLTSPVVLEEIWFPALPWTLAELENVAWQNRPELSQLRATADGHVQEAERLRAANRPQISATGRYDFEENRFQTPQAITTAAVVLDWSVYDGGKSRRAASAELTRASGVGRMIDDLRSRIGLELLTAWNRQQEAAARQTVAKEAWKQSQENLRVSTLRFSQGVAVGSEVLDAEANAVQCEYDYYNAIYDETLAQVQLRYSAGILGGSD